MRNSRRGLGPHKPYLGWSTLFSQFRNSIRRRRVYIPLSAPLTVSTMLPFQSITKRLQSYISGLESPSLLCGFYIVHG
ncbi:hypothetical protein BDW66DRAFT_97062 [Aspergillus desertorum]